MTNPATPGEATPRTDDAADHCRTCGLDFADLDVAQQLERELNCAQENFHVTNQAYIKADARAVDAERQLRLRDDEMRGHMKLEDDLKVDLARAQARVAEQAKDFNEVCLERGRLQARVAALEKDAVRLNWIFSTLHDGEIRERLQAVSDAHALGGMKGSIRVGDFRAAIDAAISAGKDK
jgi:hypothetical protein